VEIKYDLMENDEAGGGNSSSGCYLTNT